MRPYRAAAPRHEVAGALHIQSPMAGRLNAALATKLVSMLRCRRHHFMAKRFDAKDVIETFLEHSRAEQRFADLIADRIVELHEEPRFSPDSLGTRSHAPFFEVGARLEDMVREDLDATRAAIDAGREFLAFVGARDAGTRRLVMAILDADQARARALTALISTLPNVKASLS
jgi:bacterioferritin